VPDFDTARADSPLDLLEQLTITPTNLWYFMALALYFAVAKAVRQVPTALVLVPAFLLSAVAAADLIATPGNRGGLLQNLVFFLAGLRFRPMVERLASTANWKRVALFGGVYGAALAVMTVLGANDWFGVWPLVSVAAAAFGIVLAAKVATRWERLGTAVASIGRRTLPIYVLHMPVLALLHAATVDALSAGGQGVQLAFAVAEPVLMTALVVAVCLALHRGFQVVRFTWLFDLPARRVRAVDWNEQNRKQQPERRLHDRNTGPQLERAFGVLNVSQEPRSDRWRGVVRREDVHRPREQRGQRGEEPVTP